MQRETALKSLEDYAAYIGDRGPAFANPNARKLCVSIASVKRERVKYLEQTIATLLTRTPISLQDRIQMTLYNLDVPASKHTAAKSLSKMIQVQDESYLTVDPDVGPITSRNVKTKEFLDYITLLTAEERRDCDHYLVLEDDVLASKEWAKKVFGIISEVEKKGQNYSMVKLFSVERYGNGCWNWKKPFDIFLIAVFTIFFTAIIYGGMIGIARLINFYKKDEGLHELKNPDAQTIWGSFSSLNFIALIFLLVCCFSFVIFVDKKSLLNSPNGISKSDIGALYQANLYTKDALSRWNRFLRRVYDASKLNHSSLKPKDLYVPSFNKSQQINGKNFVHMMYRPSVFQHTGIESTIGNNRSFKTALISYTFPDDDVPIEFNRDYIESDFNKI